MHKLFESYQEKEARDFAKKCGGFICKYKGDTTSKDGVFKKERGWYVWTQQEFKATSKKVL